MLSLNNYLPILVAGAVHMGVMLAWYSDYAFGPMWRKLGGCKISKKDVQMKLGLQALCSILVAAALMVAINTLAQAQGAAESSGFSQLFSWFLDSTSEGASMMNAMKVAGFFWMGFLMPGIASACIWCDHPLNRFLLCAAGELVSLVGMGLALSYLV
jgi:hypothetical protein